MVKKASATWISRKGGMSKAAEIQFSGRNCWCVNGTPDSSQGD
jgi:hypothetical protein